MGGGGLYTQQQDFSYQGDNASWVNPPAFVPGKLARSTQSTPLASSDPNSSTAEPYIDLDSGEIEFGFRTGFKL